MACKYTFKGKEYTKEEFNNFVAENLVEKKSVPKYTRVLFPTGNTASKIEGHSTLEEFKKQKEDRLQHLKKENKLYEVEKTNYGYKVSAGNQFISQTFDKIEQAEEWKNEHLKGKEREIEQLENELKRIETEGFAALKPIFKFYEETVYNTLKKLYPVNRIKDEYGNEWYEIELSTKRDVGEIYFSKTQNSLFKKDVGLNKKEIDVSNQGKINKKVKLYNAKNNTSYYIKWNRVGQSNLYNWEILNYTPQPQSYYSKPNQLESEQVSKEEKFNSSEVVPKMKQILEVLGISTEISTNIFKNQQRINSLKALPQTKETKEQIEKLESEGYLDDVEALADILNRVITFSEGNLSEDNFTEETIHFIVDILEQKDQKLFNVFMDKVRGYKIYSDTLEVYKTDPNYRNADNSINYYKIKKEAIAKLLTAKLINNDYIEDKKELLASLWEALSNFIKSLFGKLDYTLKDEFTEFADKINSNYITKSDRQYLGNQTFAKRKETPKNKLNKSKRLFGTSSTSELDYNSSPSQVRAYFESLRDKFSKTIVKNEQGEEEEVYVFDGKNKVRATSIANSKGAFEGINQSEWAKLLRDAKLQKGNTVHKTIEDIINRYIDKNTGKRLETPYKAPETLEVSADVYLKLQEHVVNRLNSYPKGTLFSTELPVVNEEDGYAGTIDFIAFLPNGKIDILDWKTMDINYKMGTEKFQRFDVSPFNQAYWRNQLTLYKNAIASHILVPANKDIFRYTRAIPIATDMEAKLVDKSKGFKPENMYYTIKSVKIGDVNPEKIKKEEFFLTPVAIRTELTGDKKLDEVVSKLWGIYDKIQTITYSKDEKYKKKIESDRILSAIRELQVKKTATLFTGLFNDSFNRFKEISKKKPEFINNLKKGQKVLEKTQEEQLTDYLTNLYDAISFLSAFDKFPNTVRSLYEEKETTDYDKVVLRETLRLWRDAGDVKTSLIEETENVLTKLAEAYGIDDFTGYDSQNSNSLLNWIKDSLHRDEKSIQLTTRIINAIGIISDQRSKLYFSDEGKFTTTRKKFEEWATKNKKSLQEAYSHLLQKDNGKTIRKLISKLKPEYFTEIITKQKEFTELYNSIEESLIKQGYKGVMLKNELYKKYKEQITPWLKENFDIEKYNQLYQEALKKYTESLKDIRADEDDIIDKQKKEKWLQDWVNENNILINPRTLFNKYSPLFKALKEEKWYSNEYKFLLKSENKALLETYNLFQEINKYARNIGMLDDVKESWAFLPAIEEFGFWGAIKAIFLGKIKNLLKKHVEINPDIDPITGRESKKIPVLYKHVNEDSKDFLSNDLFYTFSIWADHIIKYEIVSQMEFRFKAIQLIESLKEYENPITSIGNLAVSINNKLDVWDKTRLAKRVKGRGVENDLEDYINKYIYGTSDVKPAYYKLLDLIYNYTALNFLGISATSWVSNFVGGRFSASLLSGKHFSKNDSDIAAFAVMGVYNKDLLKRGENIPKKSMWLIDILGTTIESQYDTSKFDKFRDSKIHINNLAFAGFKAGDHFIQNNIAIAIFMNTTIRDGKFVNINDLVKEKYPDLYNKPQKERIELSKKIDKEIAELKKTDNLFHYIETKDNKFSLKGINLNSSEGQSELIRYQNMIKSYIKDAIGNTDPWDMSILRMKWYAKFLTQFKNWMFRVVGSKFSSLENKYDRDRFSYGRTRIYFKTAFSKYFLPIVAEQIKSLIPLVPYADAKTGNVKLLEASKDFYQQKKLEFAKQGKPFNLSEREFTDLYLNGIKNQIKEFNGLITLMLIVSIIGAGLDDDDNLLDPVAPEFDKTKWQWKVLSRILFKVKRELFFNYDPEQGFNMFKNPIPVIGAIAQLWDATQAVAKEPVLRLTGDESDENENHAWNKVMNATPLVRELHFWALATSEDYADWVGVNQPKVDL